MSSEENNNKGDGKMNMNVGDVDRELNRRVNDFKQGGFSPQHSGKNSAIFKNYDDVELIVTNLTFDDISQFLMDNIQEINPVNISWERYEYRKILSNINRNDDTAIDTVIKITGAHYQDGDFLDGFEVIPILQFKKMDAVRKISIEENLGALAREVYHIDFNKIKNKNRKFFPKYGMISSIDNVNNIVSVNVNIINVIVNALGFDPKYFGKPHERNKLFITANQKFMDRKFRVGICKNKYLEKNENGLFVGNISVMDI